MTNYKWKYGPYVSLAMLVFGLAALGSILLKDNSLLTDIFAGALTLILLIGSIGAGPASTISIQGEQLLLPRLFKRKKIFLRNITSLQEITEKTDKGIFTDLIIQSTEGTINIPSAKGYDRTMLYPALEGATGVTITYKNKGK